MRREVLQDDRLRASRQPCHRVLGSGNLAGTQALISMLTQRCADCEASTNLLGARTMFDVVTLVSDAMRDVENRDADYLEANNVRFNASFIVGGQIDGEPMRLFRTYAEGNLIEAAAETNFPIRPHLADTGEQ